MLSCVPRSDAKGFSIQDDGKLVAVLTDHGPFSPFELRDPSGALLLKGRKRNSFVLSRWFDAADKEGVRRVTLRAGQFRTKRAAIVLADGRALTIQMAGEPLAASILTGNGDTVAEITADGNGTLQIVTERPELSTTELLSVVGLWRLMRGYNSAVAQASGG